MHSPVSHRPGRNAKLPALKPPFQEKKLKSELKNLDCYHNMRTFTDWLNLGWKVRKGEKAFRSIVVREIKDKDGDVIKKISRPCFLYYYRQVEKIDAGN